MSLAELAQHILGWVKTNLRSEDGASDPSLLLETLLKLKPFKSNLTKSLNQTGAEITEQVDFLEWLAGQDVSSEWHEVVKSLLQHNTEVMKQVDITLRTPVRGTGEKSLVDEEKAHGSETRRVLFEDEPHTREAASVVAKSAMFKKPEVVLTQQGTRSVLEFYVDFMDSVQDLEYADSEKTVLFKAGLNSACRQMYLAGVKCGFLDRNNLKEVTRYIAGLQKISEVTLLNDKDRMNQRIGETPEEFLVRWSNFLVKAEVMGLAVHDQVKTFTSKLSSGATIVRMVGELADKQEDYAKVLQAAEVVQSVARHKVPFKQDYRADRGYRPETKPKGDEKSAKPSPSVGKEKRCFNCNRLGHFARQCKAPKRNQAQQQLGRLRNGVLGERAVLVALDSCADVSVISKNIDCSKLGKQIPRQVNFTWGITPLEGKFVWEVSLVVEGVSMIVHLFEVDQSFLGDAEIKLLPFIYSKKKRSISVNSTYEGTLILSKP